MRVLQICHKPPLPPIDGGCIAINNISRGLIKELESIKVLTINTLKHPFDLKHYDQNYLEKIGHTKQILDVKKGDLVIWDSRTFHQNTCGSLTCEEERLVQYLCYLPKNATRNTCEQQEIRRNAFDNLRTTNHWPYLMATVPEQPMSYNFCNPDDPIFIDYESLPVPNLEDLKEKIEELL